MPLHADRGRASSFGDDATQYDRARPSYPPELIDFLLERGPRTVLDIGCGTGIAARHLATRGCRVLGVEPDERMAVIARAAGLQVEVAPFEAWEPAGRRFDLAVSAQAWHWIEATSGTTKVGEVLVPGGTAAFFWNVGRPGDRQRSAFDAVYRRRAPELASASVLRGEGVAERVRTAALAVERDGRFDEIIRTSFHREVSYSTDDWLDLLATHSDHRVLDETTRSALFAEIGTTIEDALGGVVHLIYETVCVRARRT